MAPLAVAVPLLVAAAMIVVHPVLTRTLSDALAVATALATTVMIALLLVHVGHGLEVYWFGGWHPREGVAIGIDFAVGPIGAGLAAFVSLLMVAALVYAWRYIEIEHPYFHVLMLTFMAGMVGFCLSGDLFNMFVMFEVMSVSAVALVGYKVHERAALEGGLGFAVINTIGAFLFVLGIAFIYGHTGALNLAQIGKALQHSGNGRVVVVAFALLTSALLIKAAVVPFHFWLADAYTVALNPVCLLLAGAMSEMGIYGLARIWFSAFEPALGAQTEVIRAIFVGAGLVTALWGAGMALSQDHLKRLLAFVTISFVGIYLVGVGLLTEAGIGAVAIYVLADGFGKALLFACVGIVQAHFGRLSQARLHGQARALRGTAFLFFAGALLIGSLPPFGSFLGKAMLDDASIDVGYRFVPAVITLASALTAAALLRAGARVFFGWGEHSQEPRDAPDTETERETDGPPGRTPATMFLPAVALLIGAAGLGIWFGFASLAETAAHHFVDVAGYRAAVFGKPSPLHSITSPSPEWFDYLYGGGATLLALALAALDLWGTRLTPAWRRVQSAAGAAITPIRLLHTGRIGDYTAALVLGVGVFGALIAITLR